MPSLFLFQQEMFQPLVSLSVLLFAAEMSVSIFSALSLS